MDVTERVRRVLANTVEAVTREELEDLLAREERPRAYVGLEPSGLLHLGTGPIVAEKLKDFVAAGLDVTVLLADWHAYINDKFGGDWEKIGAAAAYFREGYRALGVPDAVRYVTASELVRREDYWRLVLQVLKASTLARVKRALDIMGRQAEAADLDASKLLYPAMQVADIHALDLHLAYGGMDQRHAHMLYRDVAPKLGWRQVVAVHTPLLSSLQGGGRMDTWDLKMSKSRPETAIFVHDSPAEIEEKVRRAFCPPKEAEGNPVLQFFRYLLFPRFGALTVERSPQHGGEATFDSYGALEAAYRDGQLHPQDLKAAAVRYLEDLLADVRAHFERRPEPFRRVRDALASGAR